MEEVGLLGDCFGNAVVEIIDGRLKQERIHWRHYQTRFSAQQNVLHYSYVFNINYRPYSYFGYKNPKQYEVETKNVKKVAHTGLSGFT